MRPSRFRSFRQLAEADQFGLAVVLEGVRREAVSFREASYFSDCPRVPAGGDGHPGACMADGDGGSGGGTKPSDRLSGTKVADADGKPLRVYHGSRMAFSDFDSAKVDATALYGPGFYFTEDPALASEYAMPSDKFTKLQAQADELQSEIDTTRNVGIPRLQAAGNEAGVAVLRQGLAASIEDLAAIEKQMGALDDAPNVRPARLALQNPFDVEHDTAGAKAIAKAGGFPLASKKDADASEPVSDLYHRLLVGMRRAGKGTDKVDLQRIMRAAGFDGVTHTGGILTGGKRLHRVWIAFEPKQVVPAFGESWRESDSYFARCDRDELGHCLPEGGGEKMPDGSDSSRFKKIDPEKDKVDGRIVRDGPVPNTDSIAASFNDYDVLPGIREVPMSAFEVTAPSKLFYAANDIDHVDALAERIRQSGEISPLIVVVDPKGAYVLEGGHRLGALHVLGAKSFPALVVLDLDDQRITESTGRRYAESLREGLPAIKLDMRRTKDALRDKGRVRIDEFNDDLDDALGDILPPGESGSGGPNPMLAAHIDRNLGVGIWTGSTFEDRTTHSTEAFARNFVGEIEKSLLAQESYDDFEARLFDKLGISDADPGGSLAQFNTLLKGEANLAWNEAMVSANADQDTAMVWECQLKPTSTPGCIWRHGRLIDDLDDAELPRHFGCGCQATTIPNPASDDPDRAAAGQAMLEAMEAEREAAGGGEQFEEAAVKPSRFLGLRSLVEASYFADCPRVPAGGDGHPGACAPSDGASAGGSGGKAAAAKTSTPEFKRWFGDSKVVDGDGEPLVVYRGAKASNEEIAAPAWFTTSVDTASTYAGTRNPVTGKDTPPRSPGGHIAPVYLSIRNPYEATFAEIANATNATIEKLQARGFDGMVRTNDRTKEKWFVPFGVPQVKSVFNRGTFDPKSPKISETLKPTRFRAFRETA